MLWFTGSATEGLPFIHDSFRANPKAVHHTPRHLRPDKPTHTTTTRGTTTTTTTSGTTTTARTLNHRDITAEVLDGEVLKLPAVQPMVVTTNGQLTSRSTGRGEGGKDPASFTSYMHRYKACARLKGISPSRAYCSTRMRSTTSETHQPPHPHDTELPHTHPHPSSSSKEALVTTAMPLSNLRLDAKPDHPPKPDLPPGAGDASSPTDAPDRLPGETPPAVAEPGPGPGPEQASVLEKQVDEKLKIGNSTDDGMATPGLHSHRQRGRRSRMSEGRGGRGGSGHVASRIGGGRPLGDIVSPQRLQELLSHRDEHTLPYTYYRTSLGTQRDPMVTPAPTPDSLD